MNRSEVIARLGLFLILNLIASGVLAGGSKKIDPNKNLNQEGEKGCSALTQEECIIQGFKKEKLSIKEVQSRINVNHDLVGGRFYSTGIKLAKPAITKPSLLYASKVIYKPIEVPGISPGDAKPFHPITTESLYQKRVLSLGEDFIGTTVYLAQYGADAYGIDIDDSYLKGRDSRVYLYAYPDRLLYGDATKISSLAIAKKPFDLIYSCNLIHFLDYPDVEKVLTESLINVKPGSDTRHTFKGFRDPNKSSMPYLDVQSFEFKRLLQNVIDFGLSNGFRVKVRLYQYYIDRGNGQGNDQLEPMDNLLILTRWD